MLCNHFVPVSLHTDVYTLHRYMAWYCVSFQSLQNVLHLLTYYTVDLFMEVRWMNYINHICTHARTYVEARI